MSAQTHRSNEYRLWVCMRSHVYLDNIDLFVWTGTLTPDSHQTLISMILMGGISLSGKGRYEWTLTFLIIRKSLQDFTRVLYMAFYPFSMEMVLELIIGQGSWTFRDLRLWLKAIIHLKMKICWKCTRPQAIPDVDEFVSSSEKFWRNLALHHLLTNGSSAVNGCRQNKSLDSC